MRRNTTHGRAHPTASLSFRSVALTVLALCVTSLLSGLGVSGSPISSSSSSSADARLDSAVLRVRDISASLSLLSRSEGVSSSQQQQQQQPSRQEQWKRQQPQPNMAARASATAERETRDEPLPYQYYHRDGFGGNNAVCWLSKLAFPETEGVRCALADSISQIKGRQIWQCDGEQWRFCDACRRLEAQLTDPKDLVGWKIQGC
ncbi:hypothetical protein BCV70DRAFT_198772 [Testicularia cyperi]|uniref:Uncharacterized protein n=1 Tax=Testicularia cyperi TaxID=1882483 RepID=A0A317XSK5_9BASI|nr:hypothetical protein BCV70DRAFT_198772 [Testicularia cyperi]